MLAFRPEFDRPTVAMGPTVLVVDDDPAFRNLLGLTLKSFGVRHHLAGNCSQAVSLLKECPAVSAVLLDVRLPDKDGPHTLQALREVLPQLPAVYMTGDPNRLPAEHGGQAVLLKPFKMDELLGLIQHLGKAG